MEDREGTHPTMIEAGSRQYLTHICRHPNNRSQAKGSALAVGSVSPNSRRMSGAMRNMSSCVAR
jgi:hypothetical protein